MSYHPTNTKMLFVGFLSVLYGKTTQCYLHASFILLCEISQISLEHLAIDDHRIHIQQNKQHSSWISCRSIPPHMHGGPIHDHITREHLLDLTASKANFEFTLDHHPIYEGHRSMEVGLGAGSEVDHSGNGTIWHGGTRLRCLFSAILWYREEWQLF